MGLNNFICQCDRITGFSDIWSNLIVGVLMMVFWMILTFILLFIYYYYYYFYLNICRLSQAGCPPNVMELIQSFEGLTKTEKEFLLPYCLCTEWVSSCLLSWIQTLALPGSQSCQPSDEHYIISFPGSQAFRLRLELNITFPGSPACWLRYWRTSQHMLLLSCIYCICI